MSPEQRKRWPWAQEMVTVNTPWGSRFAANLYLVPSMGDDEWLDIPYTAAFKRRSGDDCCCGCGDHTADHRSVLTWDDWGDGPMCVMCGRIEDKWEVCDE